MSAAARVAALTAPRVPPTAERDILAIVVALQADVRDLTRRVEQIERAQGVAAEAPARRRMPLDEAGRRGLLPRCPRTVRNWLATAESRALWKTDLFVRRIANRLEVDLDGLEEWRRQMAAPAAPAWPKRWGARGPQ